MAVDVGGMLASGGMERVPDRGAAAPDQRLGSTVGSAKSAHRGGSGLRVGIVMPLAEQRGGAEWMLLHLLRESSGRAVCYHVAFLEPGPMAGTVAAMGHPVSVFPAGHLGQGGAYLRTVLALARWIRRERLDGVVSWMSKAHLYAAPAASVSGRLRRLVWFDHSVAVGRAAPLAVRLVHVLPAREVWCPSQHAALAQRRASPRRQVRVVYPCVDLVRFDPAHLPPPARARHNLGLPPRGPLIGMVSRLERWKGCDTFVAAMPAILAQLPDARFVIVGGEHFAEPGYAVELRRKAADLGLGERLLLTGHRTDVPVWMQALDLVVNPSYCEPFGMAAIEAMALAKPVVAAAAGGPLEQIRDGETGRLFPVQDAAALAERVVGVLSTPDRGAALGRCAQAEVRRRFGAVRLAAETEAALFELFG